MDKPCIVGPIKFSDLSFAQRTTVLDLTHQNLPSYAWSGFRMNIDRGQNPTMFLFRISGEIIGWSAQFEHGEPKRMRFVREDKRGLGYGTQLKERVDCL